MPFTPEMQFDRSRPLTEEEIEAIATRAANKVLMRMQEEKKPDLSPAFLWMMVGTLIILLLNAVALILIK